MTTDARHRLPSMPRVTLHTALYDRLDAMPMYSTYLCKRPLYQGKLRHIISWMYGTMRAPNRVAAYVVKDGLLFVRVE